MSASSYGALKTLVAMLTAFLTPYGIEVVYGEENIHSEKEFIPRVVVVPVGGSWVDSGCTPGYYKDANVDLNNIWMTRENIDLVMWSFDPDPLAQPIDHADATEDLRARVLQAFQSQAPNGLMFRPLSGSWEQMQEGVNRFGRAYRMQLQVDITVPDVLPVDVTVDEVTINPSIEA
jgi:hypothetical protein